LFLMNPIEGEVVSYDRDQKGIVWLDKALLLRPLDERVYFLNRQFNPLGLLFSHSISQAAGSPAAARAHLWKEVCPPSKDPLR